LKNAKKFWLQLEGEISDFVKKERAPVGRLKAADSPNYGTCEGARSCPKSSLSSKSPGIAAQLRATNWLRVLAA
jgi:hypothetical protein